MRAFVDGSTFAVDAADGPDAAPWRAWRATFEGELEGRLCTSAGALARMRSGLRSSPPATKRAGEDAVVGVEVLGVSDQALATAAHAASVVDPFRAIDVGIAVTHPDVRVMVSYDPLLCRVSAVYGLDVVTPGRASGWWDAA
ncbi:hypothetical protein Bcav_0398 [Beutenbergia cavernae DSM 12333]|uniref:PIN domain-containing protein n=1 Tax=Beutenbergia cavernae (strain ATCC BAA-8 / DSM 12333 / CCUG 43141 / JCM 11478 / NBRC 16432 / NCIMB 13614 / HKI 0122) TaxID=471853 RepID=C5BWK4_BEUC1|nr:hypothetical protein [Beutenbergia cavernae]ACQ78662.1 hypothetical protein Bcav_0398 [Beutenbergia cavernae DSM 12333]